MTTERFGIDTEHEIAQEAVEEERKRIARELHDILSHALTGIIFQATTAARVADTDVAQVKKLLADIGSTGRQAMIGLQHLIAALEASEPVDKTSGGGARERQWVLADLNVLLTSLRARGMRVTVHVEGTPRDLDPGVDLVAYLIVQEGLTNALKHAGKDSKPHVRLVWEAQRLIIQIDNQTNLAQAHHEQSVSVGRGLLGLHERTQAVGGRIYAGFRPNGTYRLTATLPLPKPEVPSTPFPSDEDHGN